MTILSKALLACAVLALPSAAIAQSTDVAYCLELAKTYRTLNRDTVTGAELAGQCQNGNAAAVIPVMEKALRDAKIDLPPRT